MLNIAYRQVQLYQANIEYLKRNQLPSREKAKVNFKLFQEIFSSIHRVIKQMNGYSRFWNPIFSIALMWRLWILNFGTYIVLFYTLSPSTKFQFAMILIAELVSFITLILEASHIPSDIEQLGKKMHHFIATNCIKSPFDRFSQFIINYIYPVYIINNGFRGKYKHINLN